MLKFMSFLLILKQKVLNEEFLDQIGYLQTLIRFKMFSNKVPRNVNNYLDADKLFNQLFLFKQLSFERNNHELRALDKN